MESSGRIPLTCSSALLRLAPVSRRLYCHTDEFYNCLVYLVKQVIDGLNQILALKRFGEGMVSTGFFRSDQIR